MKKNKKATLVVKFSKRTLNNGINIICERENEPSHAVNKDAWEKMVEKPIEFDADSNIEETIGVTAEDVLPAIVFMAMGAKFGVDQNNDELKVAKEILQKALEIVNCKLENHA